MIDWTANTWGQPGQNVHHADNGSWWGQGDHIAGTDEP